MACNSCTGPFTKGMWRITCSTCYSIYHLKCVGLNKMDYANYQEFNDWICRICNSLFFPFNHIDDNNLYELCVNMHLLPDSVDIDRLSKLNSNPFMLIKTVNVLEDKDVDPDTNFYNVLNTVRNKYYVEDE
jgi:hypothetical protein